MKNDRKIIVSIIYTVIGATLFVLGQTERSDSFWCGMGGALVAVGIVRLIQYLRYRNDKDYREKQEIEVKDERNRFIRNKAWAWAGYSFIMVSAVLTIVLKLLGQETLSFATGYAVCIIITLYWISYFILKKKY